MPDRAPSEPNTGITNRYEQLSKQIQNLVNSEAGDFEKQVLNFIPGDTTFSKEDMSNILLALLDPGCREAIIQTLSQPSSDGNSIGHYIKITDRPDKRNQNFQVIRDPNGQLSLAIRIQKVAESQGARIGTGALNKVSSILRLDSSENRLQISYCIQRKAHNKINDPKETEAARLGDLERKLHTDVVYTANSTVVGPSHTITHPDHVKAPNKQDRLTVIQDNAGDELFQYLKDCEEESPERNFITVFQQLAVQIKAAHAKGHPCCDIKTENTLIQERDGLPKVILIDQAGDKARQLKKPDDWPYDAFSDIEQAQKKRTLDLQNYNNLPSQDNEELVFQAEQAVQDAIERHYEDITKPLSITKNTPLNMSTVANLNNLGGIAATANTSYPGNGGNLDFLIDNMGENYIHHALLRIDPNFKQVTQQSVMQYLQGLNNSISDKHYRTSPETGMPAWAADSFGFLNTMIEVSQAFLKPNQSDDNQKGREMLHQWLVDQLVGIYVTCAYNDDLSNLKDLKKSSDDEVSVYNPLLVENSPKFPSIDDLEKEFYSTLQAIRNQHPLCFSIPQLDAATAATQKLFPDYRDNAPRRITAPVGDTFVCWRITHTLLDFIHYLFLYQKQENLLTREQVRDKMSLLKMQIKSDNDITLTQDEVKKIETAKNKYKMRFSESGDLLLELAKANAKLPQTLKKEERSPSFYSGQPPKLRKNL